MNDQIYQDLKSLHLSGMAQSWMLLHETRKLGCKQKSRVHRKW